MFAKTAERTESKMKRVIAAVLCLLLALTVFSGCGIKKPSNARVKIITTIYPVYEWVKNIADDADGVEVSLLLDKGVDLHSFQPTAENIVDISDCDVFIYVGGESDTWVDDVMKEKKNKDMLSVNLMDELGEAAKEEENVEGMEPGDEEDGDEKEYDEHIWLSLKNASKLCKCISDKLSEKDSDNKDKYEKNAKEYIEKLGLLDRKYAQTCSSAKHDTLIFADRFPFRYMTDDYKLKYYAAFKGCSAESEASLNTLVFLAEKLDSSGLHSLIILDGSEKKIVKGVIDAAKTKDVEILTLNSMQSSIGDDDTYLSIMEDNLSVLQKALN